MLIQQTGKRALVIAHREELLKQAQEKLASIAPDLKAEIEMADQHASDEAHVVVASIATIGRTNSKRIGRFEPKDFCTVVIDEAHHASADTYRNALKHMGLLKGKEEDDWNKECLLLGVTATPSRNDNKGIDVIFDEVAYKVDILDGIRGGWLVPIHAYRVQTNIDISKVKTTAGDFNLEQLAEEVNVDERNLLIVKSYQERFAGKKAICFAVDVAHAKVLAETFRQAGVSAAYVAGEMKDEERQSILAAYKKGSIHVLVNCMLLTEGFDEPSIEVVLMARPTQSGILFIQMLGRGTRLCEGKDRLSVVDFVDNTYKNNIKTTASLLGINGDVDFMGNDILEYKDKLDKILELAPNMQLKGSSIEELDYIIEQVDLTSGLAVPDEIIEFTTYDWQRYGESSYRINLGKNHYFIIEQTLTGQFIVKDKLWDPAQKKEHMEMLGERPTIEQAVLFADRHIAVKYTDALKLIDTGARWRKEKITDGQAQYLKGYGINDTVLQSLNKGNAARLLDRLFNSKLKMKRKASNW